MQEKVTGQTVTKEQLVALFERHCECRDLSGIDLSRTKDNHAAIHDCDTEILADIQVALGIVVFDDIGRVQAIHEARDRCADHINRDAQKGA